MLELKLETDVNSHVDFGNGTQVLYNSNKQSMIHLLAPYIDMLD